MVDNPYLAVQFLFDKANSIDSDFGEGIIDQVSYSSAKHDGTDLFVFDATRYIDYENEDAEPELIYTLAHVETDINPIMTPQMQVLIDKLTKAYKEKNNGDPPEDEVLKLQIGRSVIFNNLNPELVRYRETAYYEFLGDTISMNIASIMHDNVADQDMEIRLGNGAGYNADEVEFEFQALTGDLESQHKRTIVKNMLAQMLRSANKNKDIEEMDSTD